ncbi:hypothetical protein OF83DRAFT_1157501 [Amylostereum chailletii]|nr:hypothetical protein OF83DRAFT_1157501 [Amylostereum chailletii]
MSGVAPLARRGEGRADRRLGCAGQSPSVESAGSGGSCRPGTQMESGIGREGDVGKSAGRGYVVFVGTERVDLRRCRLASPRLAS